MRGEVCAPDTAEKLRYGLVDLISIIVPTKNEPAIQELVDGINRVMHDRRHEIIVVDKSDIHPILHDAHLLPEQGNSLGEAFIEGFEKAKGDVIILMDGDGSHRPEDLPKLVGALDGSEMAIGSKFVHGGRTEDTTPRRTVSKIFALLARLITGIKVRDPMTGFMAVRRSVIGRARLSPKGYKVVLELMYKSKVKVSEVPIIFRKRVAGESKVGFNLRGVREALRILALLASLRFSRRDADDRNIRYLKPNGEGRI